MTESTGSPGGKNRSHRPKVDEPGREGAAVEPRGSTSTVQPAAEQW